MEHNLPLITTIAAGFGMALLLGFIAERVHVPALVGYLIAGIVIGPMTPGIVADMSIASQLAEIGVMLLMFGVGLHFSLGDLLTVKRIAIPGAVAQMSLATLLGLLLARFWGWEWGDALVFGLSLSCASTVVLLKALEARGVLETMNGRIAVGWLVVEDLATVLILVLLPPLAGILGGDVSTVADQDSLWAAIGKTLLQITAFIALMLVAGRRVIPWLLWQVARTGSREMFTLSVIATAIGIAYGATTLFNVSFALGAFFAGMVMRESEFSHRAATESLPLRDAFSVLFFVSVGMLFDPTILVEAPIKVLATVLIIILGKSLAAAALVLVFRYPLNTALTVAASLAQIGEFSFILAGLGLTLGLASPEAMNLILAGALISIALNPLVFAFVPALQRGLLARFSIARRLNQREDPYAQLPMSTDRKYLEGQVVLVGFGRVGQRVATALGERNIPYVVAEQNRECVEDLRKKGIAAVYGDAIDPGVLIQAHIAKAAMLVVATSSPVDVRTVVDIARTLNPDIEVVVRAHNADELRLLRSENIGITFLGEDELAKSMSHYVVERFAPAAGR
ncbi:efflux pump/antiporter [Betaproteobacteria bacterium]|nr:efflux pump/antiporter [Betaproteobacteria bacterium]GHT95059.1 efflux pump/antiporter [Betaproteobacteria bacterium]GHU12488.1 efflux pump/antiporter [Betaproteobacteria bacterium]GHU22319.1 efflux pump/antiporter [Betaproteobacteria bacterium]